MIIGIDASRAFVKERTGIEEYSYQVIKNLREKLNNHQVILYVRKGQADNIIKFSLPRNWRIKEIKLPYLWTQLGLSWEMLLCPVDALFVPAHTVPWIHPKNTYVTVHGLEYEILPESYSFWEKIYMRLSIRKSCQWAKKIITVSENSKKDLMKLYDVSEDKIKVIYEGVGAVIADESQQASLEKSENHVNWQKFYNDKYLLFVGRLEERKNIIGIIRAFEILKEHYKIPHKLVLVGKFGYGEKKIRQELVNVNCVKDILLTGFVSEAEKWKLMKKAEVFLFPTFYEGFGLPILEAQALGTPVVASDNSSIPEITDCSAILVDPNNAEEIADATHKIISDENCRNDLVERGYENVKRFSWNKCAREIAKLLLEK